MAVRILQGDARTLLPTLPDASVQCVVTSPPYYNLRDYGVTGQLGLESTPKKYVASLVAVFREVRRILKDDGTLWLNLGDVFSAKQLQGIPWRVAFALQADGWWLRSDIVWHKPDPMPESVTDRPTRAHEYIFLFAKSATYYYNADAVREPALWAHDPRAGAGHIDYNGKRTGEKGQGQRAFVSINPDGRNCRSVWTLTTEASTDAHFATFPQKLVARCLQAGSRIGDTVLDPFGGSGTVGKVAEELGRNSVLIELNPEYVELIEDRTAQLGLFTWRGNG